MGGPPYMGEIPPIWGESPHMGGSPPYGGTPPIWGSPYPKKWGGSTPPFFWISPNDNGGGGPSPPSNGIRFGKVRTSVFWDFLLWEFDFFDFWGSKIPIEGSKLIFLESLPPQDPPIQGGCTSPPKLGSGIDLIHGMLHIASIHR